MKLEILVKTIDPDNNNVTDENGVRWILNDAQDDDSCVCWVRRFDSDGCLYLEGHFHGFEGRDTITLFSGWSEVKKYAKFARLA